MTPGEGSPAPGELMLSAIHAAQALALATSVAGEWDLDLREEVITGIDRAAEQLSLARGRLLRAHSEDGQWARAGDRDFVGWRGRTGKGGRSAAQREVGLAEGLGELPVAEGAVSDGTIRMEHAKVLTDLRARCSEAVRRALAEGGEAELVAMAARMDAGAFARRVAAWAAALDAAQLEADHARVRAERSLRAFPSRGGVRLEAFGDTIAMASVTTLLEAISGPPSREDYRTRDQRMFDALVSLCEGTLAQGTHAAGAQVRPHLALLVGEQAWASYQAARSSSGCRGSGEAGGEPGTAGSASASGPVACAELDGGPIVPWSELERIACDCQMTRVVMNAAGTPLDVGRTQRTYSRELRRAVVARDRHCRWPGCTIPAAWSEVHHIRWFRHGGATSLENGITLCVISSPPGPWRPDRDQQHGNRPCLHQTRWVGRRVLGARGLHAARDARTGG